MRISDFPNDGRIWRLNWIGNLDYGEKERSLSVAKLSFSPIKDYNELRYSRKAITEEKPCFVTTNIGNLPLLSLGSAWRDGRPVENDSIKADEAIFEVYSPLVPNFLPASSLIRSIRYNIGDELNEAPCLFIRNVKVISASYEESISTYTNIIFPCPEILRFYFATSSTLIRKLIHHEVNSLDQLIIRVDPQGNKRTFKTPEGELYLTLRKQLFDADAWTIARMYCNPIALNEIKRMRSYITVAGILNKQRYIYISLPFSGMSNLKCQGFWTKTVSGESAYFVLRIVSCTADIPINGLIIDRENSNRVLKHFGKKHSGQRRTVYQPNDNGEIVIGGETESSNYFILTTIQKQQERFLALKKKTLKKVYRETAKYKRRSSLTREEKVNSFQTGEGCSTRNNVGRLGIEIDTVLNTEEEKLITASNLFMLWRTMLLLIDKLKYNCNVVVVQTGERTKEFKLSYFSTTSSWATINDIAGERGRQALWIEIEKDNIWNYVVEWEMDSPKYGIYFMTFNNGQRPSDTELQNVMADWAKNVVNQDKIVRAGSPAEVNLKAKNVVNQDKIVPGSNVNKEDRNKAREKYGLGRGWVRETINHPKEKKESEWLFRMVNRISQHLNY